jgi:hypothetical protein
MQAIDDFKLSLLRRSPGRYCLITKEQLTIANSVIIKFIATGDIALVSLRGLEFLSPQSEKIFRVVHSVEDSL